MNQTPFQKQLNAQPQGRQHVPAYNQLPSRQQPDAQPALHSGQAQKTQYVPPFPPQPTSGGSQGIPSLAIQFNMPGAKPTTYDLTKQVINIGRDPSNDLVIDAPVVSHFHAQIVHEGNQFILIHPHPSQPHTTNGLLYQGRRILGNEPFRKPLVQGDIFRIGNEHGALVTLTYNDGSEAPLEAVPGIRLNPSGASVIDRSSQPQNPPHPRQMYQPSGQLQRDQHVPSSHPQPGESSNDLAPGRRHLERKKQPREHWFTLQNISIVVGIAAALAGVLGLLLQLGVVHPFSPEVTPTATPNLSSFSDARMSCQSDNTINPKTLWRGNGLKSTIYNCNATGLVIAQTPQADTIASIFLPLPLPHEPLVRNYSISVQMSGLASPQSCAGVVFRHSGYRAYYVEICLDGVWSIGKSFATNGITNLINHGTYTVNRKNSYLLLVEVSDEVASISIEGQGLPPVTLDPTFKDESVDLYVDGTDPLNPTIDPGTNPGASATFSQFIFQPLG